MKKIYSILLIIVCILFLPKNTYAYEKVDDTSLKIYDYGELLTSDEEIYLKGLIDKYIEEYDMDLVILTKKDYTGDMKSYAQDFYDYNNFGIGNKKDGILLFLNVDSKGPIVEIVTTGEAILVYDDERIDELITSMSSAKTNGNKAIVEIFIRRADKYASRGIPESNRHYYIDESGELRKYRRSHKVMPFIVIPLISNMLTTLIIYLMARKNNNVFKAVDASTYLDANSFKILVDRKNLVSSNTSMVHISTYSGSSGHSSGAGSSISHGSSGTAHGGGGGRL